MTTHRKKHGFLYRAGDWIKEIFTITIEEFRHILRDYGVIVIFFAASLLYPLLYNGIYYNEVIHDVPVAVVDLSQTSRSREFLKKIDATPELTIAFRCASMEEAKDLFQHQKVHGIVYIPSDYSDRINYDEQATVSVYSDMSSFMYYRVMMSAANAVVQNEGEKIRYERLNHDGITGEDANIAANPMSYTSTILYNPCGGFASFLLPALLILILHQTLFLGIGMEAGSRKEENKYHLLIPANSRRSVFQIVTGKGMGYFMLYFMFACFSLGVIPRLFGLPHIGNFAEIVMMIIPFLLATVFFSMTFSVFMVKRETVLVTFIFSSLILLFISGFSWPRSSINSFWLAFGYIFPSTHGIQAYIKLNTMGANLYDINREYIALWIQTGFYFLTTILLYTLQINNSRKKANTIAIEKQALLQT